MGIFRRSVKENQQLKMVAIVAFVATITVNALANILPINGQTTGQVSDAYPNLFAPAAVTFSIWSVIYLLLAAYCAYQFVGVRGKQSAVREETIARVTPWFIATSVINALWMLAWQYHVMWLSVLLMIGLLWCLIRINRELYDKSYTLKDRLLVKAPFSIYFGWITVATIANITTWLVSIGWDGLGVRPGVWMVLVLLVGAAIGIVTTVRQRDCAYGAVLVWAYTGILIKHLSDGAWNGQYPSVLAALYILLPVLIVTVLYVARQVMSESSRR